ncbi:emp24/gp25L/p24 family/GOLD-domain-containing protein [Auriculariales sp. MPI-PUGE-AT-0066]|nr:emp24/gp25L/p24 family/GOLD-domain-containing protein [Auriculariales sp. MPI-PUGE-AT-0066]
MRVSVVALFVATLALSSNALHFYLDSNEERCFIEELPTDTIVEGHYRALEWDEGEKKYVTHEALGIQVDVDEMATGHNVVKMRAGHEGKFTFTSHDSGDHSICLSTNYTAGLFATATHIRLYLDVVVGASRHDADRDKSHVNDIADKLRDLNQKLADIKREQRYQRERESAFRDLSEDVNSRAMWYTIIQIVVILVTCTWQLRHLRRFFEDRKMR